MGGPGRIWKMADTGSVYGGLAGSSGSIFTMAAGEDTAEHSVLEAVLASEAQPSGCPAWQEPKQRQFPEPG